MRSISKTPRKNTHSRKVEFSMAMREKISKNWVKARKKAKAGRQKSKSKNRR